MSESLVSKLLIIDVMETGADYTIIGAVIYTIEKDAIRESLRYSTCW